MRYFKLLMVSACLYAPILLWGQHRPSDPRQSSIPVDQTSVKYSPPLKDFLAGITQKEEKVLNLVLLVRDLNAFITRYAADTEVVQLKVISKPNKIVSVLVKNALILTRFDDDANILFIDRSDKKVSTEILIKDFDPGLNAIDLAQTNFPFLSGAGLNVSVKENLFNPLDIDIQTQIRGALPDEQITTHATTVATIIVGRGHLGKNSRGLAPGAGLISSSFYNLFPDDLSFIDEHQIQVQNHSYGIDLESFYGLEAMAYDAFSQERPDVLHVFSAGNQGLSIPASGIYQGIGPWSNLTGNMKMAKNVLVVGAVDSFGISSDLASRGPAYDGRIKPELVTMGQRGSSESAAIASGAALLLQQAFEGQFKKLPSACLIKVILINSADDVGAPGVDFVTGYGNLNLYQAINSILESRFFEGNLKDGQDTVITLEVPEHCQHLKITLGWNDPPALPNASNALVNDLDMQVKAGNQHWLPWVLNAAPNPDSLRQTAVRGEDHHNNIEQISVENPQPGTYSVTIKASELNPKDQRFVLCYQLDSADSFYWINPSPADVLEAGKETLLRWHENFDFIHDASIFYTTDQGKHWVELDTHVDVHAHYIRWQVPEVFSPAQVRLTVNGQHFTSEEFTIAPSTSPRVGFDCANDVSLHWTPVSDADHYEIYSWDGQDMVEFDMQQDTHLIIDKQALNLNYFSILPVKADGLRGCRSNAISIEDQGAFCYLISFVSRLVDQSAQLSLTLSSLEQIAKVQIEKEKGAGNYVPIWETTVFPGLVLDFTDRDLNQGANYYRAVLIFADGRQLYSDVTNVFFPGVKSILLFPNPVPRDSEIRILSSVVSEGEIMIYDALGVLLRKFFITSGDTYIPLDEMLPGVYYYHINRENQPPFYGSFLVY
ncbi:MAG: S8 family peptidase [Saprospiraceae bacterium]|nr:S8 family peptidase [Saprospiraceae bacterium]